MLTIKQASEALSMGEVVKLFSVAFEQNFVNHFSDSAKADSLVHAVDCAPFLNGRLIKVSMAADQLGFDLKLLRFS